MLPESQLDRFMICMSMGYPDLKSEIEIAKGKSIGQSYESIEGVMTGAAAGNERNRRKYFYT